LRGQESGWSLGDSPTNMAEEPHLKEL